MVIYRRTPLAKALRFIMLIGYGIIAQATTGINEMAS